ncbi:MAG TPA: ABC transporter permease subunit [Thermoanaerobaculales bacterium]|nr:ABC transporter permease subunit [Thermoanaerobaculales bacterium]HQN96738.1 ABC transporter permease subunit [Thermoanaerobaculales bacterium]HQP43202.1 ABC transporter permease subunit [Thermoanaerobaculales bacterium]
MRAVMAIARNTFREALRDRVLYLFLGFALLLLACSKLFGLLTVGDEGKVIKDFGLAGIQFFTMLIAVMMSVLLISREVDSRTVYNILAKPVRRWQFLIGKYLGLLATVALNLALMTVVLVAVTLVYLGELDAGLLFAAAMTLLEMALLTAFATLFAVLTRPMLGTVFTLAVFVIGHVSHDIWQLTRHVDSGLVRPLVAALYAVLPNLERFNFKSAVVHDLEVSSTEVALAVGYGLAYTAMVLVLACARFRSKDLV